MTAATDEAVTEGAGGPEQLQVAFPATPTFTRIGRVTVVGLALRLGLDVDAVETLRGAVDEAVSALQGPGRISVQAVWTDRDLVVSFDNPQATVADPQHLTAVLTDLVGRASVDPHRVRLTLETSPP